MLDPKEIDNALNAHAAWKDRLKATVESGKTEVTVTTISANNQCAFGKWLYGPTITAEEKNSPEYAQVVKLHAAFHKVAGKVAALAIAGMKADALKMMDFGNEYAVTSGQLSLALKRWKETMTAATTK
jgi:methyl-accepting chemotaxis protein